MKTALMAFLMIAGMLMLASPLLPVGLASMIAGWWVHERMTPKDEDRFMAALMLLAALGVVATLLFASSGWVRAHL